MLDPPPGHYGFDLREPHNLTARAARERRTLTSSDYRDFLLPPGSPPAAAGLRPAPGLAVAAAVPALLDDRVVAVLLVAFRERELAAPGLRLLEFFADQCAISIHNAQSYDAIRQALQRETELCLKLRSADRAKGDLLLMAGHELRTPLAAVRYGLEFLASSRSIREALPEGDGDLPRDLLAQINQLDGMVEHLCQTLRSLHQRLEISGRALRIDSLVREILLCRAQEFRRQRIDVQFDNETEDAPPAVLADAAQLRYALWELITNAVKHGGAGATIAIGLRVAEQAEKPRLRIDIDNTGRGIDAEARARLFREPLGEAGELENRVVPGMGLGLYLVNKIVELHRGSIEVQSDGTSETRFTLFFPILEEARGDELHGR